MLICELVAEDVVSIFEQEYRALRPRAPMPPFHIRFRRFVSLNTTIRLREGRDVCILSYGPIMKRAFALAERFEQSGKSAAIVSVHTLKPLDRGALTEILKTYAHVVVVEECAPNGSLAMQTKQLAWDAEATCRLDTFTLQDAFIHCYGSHDDILDAHGLGLSEMTARVGLS